MYDILLSCMIDNTEFALQTLLYTVPSFLLRQFHRLVLWSLI